MRIPPPALRLCFALLLALCAFVHAKEHDFARWEKDIGAFEAKDQTAPQPKGGIVFVGSSTIVRWKTLPQDFPGLQIINRGFGGNEIEDCTHFADRTIFPYEPKMIFLRAGGNDIHAGKTPERVFADFKGFVATVQSKFPNAEIVYISMSPAIARLSEAPRNKAANEMIAQYCRENPKLKYIDTYDLPLGSDGQPRPELFVEDKLHFSPEGYKLLVERVRPFLPKP